MTRISGVRLAILGGGPAGNTCATVAATLGAEVTLVERDVIAGAAHLWDCIPSKAMIATGGAMTFARRAGYARIMLWTQDCLVAARRIYERAGFRLVEQAPHRSFGADLVEQYWARDL